MDQLLAPQTEQQSTQIPTDKLTSEIIDTFVNLRMNRDYGNIPIPSAIKITNDNGTKAETEFPNGKDSAKLIYWKKPGSQNPYTVTIETDGENPRTVISIEGQQAAIFSKKEIHPEEAEKIAQEDLQKGLQHLLDLQGNVLYPYANQPMGTNL